MKFHPIAAAAVAVLALSSASAFAAASATATLTGLTISLGKIKQSGVAPKVTFTTTSGDEIFASAVSYGPYSEQYNDTYGASVAAEGVVAAHAGHAGAAAAIVGDAFSDAGSFASTSAIATGSPVYQPSYASAYLGLSGGQATFVLGANTFLDISATYSFSTAVTGSSDTNVYEYAIAGAYLSLQGANGTTSQYSISGASIYSQDYFNSSTVPNSTQTGELDVSFVGSKTKSTTGTFYAYLTSSAQSNLSAVPEPTNIALLLAGLGAIAVVSRRRAGR
jgi:hypothetical protein